MGCVRQCPIQLTAPRHRQARSSSFKLHPGQRPRTRLASGSRLIRPPDSSEFLYTSPTQLHISGDTAAPFKFLPLSVSSARHMQFSQVLRCNHVYGYTLSFCGRYSYIDGRGVDRSELARTSCPCSAPTRWKEAACRPQSASGVLLWWA